MNHYYLNARYYNPENGNFLSLDAYPGDLKEPNSQNGYNYANNNPVHYYDPTGNYYWKNRKRSYGYRHELHLNNKEAKKVAKVLSSSTGYF